jgi:hypothetical protein
VEGRDEAYIRETDSMQADGAEGACAGRNAGIFYHGYRDGDIPNQKEKKCATSTGTDRPEEGTFLPDSLAPDRSG